MDNPLDYVRDSVLIMIVVHIHIKTKSSSLVKTQHFELAMPSVSNDNTGKQKSEMKRIAEDWRVLSFQIS